MLKYVSVAFVLSVSALIFLDLRRHPTQNWCEIGTVWIPGEGCLCDISLSPTLCAPDESGVNILFASSTTSPVTQTPRIESNQKQTFRVQLRTSNGKYPIFASDEDWGKEYGVKSVAARVEGDHEVFLLEDPKEVHWGLWEFAFHVKTSGTFSITVYFQGATQYWPENPSVDSKWPQDAFHDFSDSLEYTRAGRYLFEAYYPGDPSAGDQGWQTAEALSNMPACSTSQLGSTTGRWIDPTSFVEHLSGDFLDRFVPPTVAKGSDHWFVGDQCLMKYVTSKSARECFRGQDITYVGDSIVEEAFFDLALHLNNPDDTWDGTDHLPLTWPSTFGNSKHCAGGMHSYSRLSKWDIPSINSTMSFSWMGHPYACYNLQGIKTLDDEYGRKRILNVLADPESLWEIPLEVDQPLKEAPEERVNQNRESTVVFGSAFHDLYTLKDGDLTLEGYAEKVGAAAKLFKRYATNSFFLPALSVLHHNNHAVRLLNKLASSAVGHHGFKSIPTYYIKNERPLVDNDWHHSSRIWVQTSKYSRTPALHAGTQAFLNVACERFI